MSTSKKTDTLKVSTTTLAEAAISSATYIAAQNLAEADISNDAAYKVTADVVLGTFGRKKTIPFKLWDEQRIVACAGYDSTVNRRGFSNAARKAWSRVKSLLVTDYSVKFEVKPKSTSPDAKRKDAKRKKEAVEEAAIIKRVETYAKKEGLTPAKAAYEMAAKARDPKTATAYAGVPRKIETRDKTAKSEAWRAVTEWKKTATLADLLSVVEFINK